MVHHKIVSDIQKLVEVLFIGTVFVRVLLVGTAFAESRISSHAITKSSIILTTRKRIPKITFFAHIMFFQLFTLSDIFIVFPPLIQI